MQTIGRWLQHLIELLMALMLSVMVIAVFMNVVLRYTAGTGFASSEELARLLFVWLVCLGAILASAENRHLSFDLVQSRLPRRARQACTWITRVLVLYPILLLIQGAYVQVKVGAVVPAQCHLHVARAQLRPVAKGQDAAAAARWPQQKEGEDGRGGDET